MHNYKLLESCFLFFLIHFGPIMCFPHENIWKVLVLLCMQCIWTCSIGSVFFTKIYLKSVVQMVLILQENSAFYVIFHDFQQNLVTATLYLWNNLLSFLSNFEGLFHIGTCTYKMNPPICFFQVDCYGNCKNAIFFAIMTTVIFTQNQDIKLISLPSFNSNQLFFEIKCYKWHFPHWFPSALDKVLMA